MSTLKSLVARSNEGLSFRKKSKQRFGLGSFVAASTDQMLMTRGGYGSPYGYYSGPESWWDAPGGGAGGSSSANPYNPVAGVGEGIVGSIKSWFARNFGSSPEVSYDDTTVVIDASNLDVFTGPVTKWSFMLNHTSIKGGGFRDLNDSIKVGSSGQHYSTKDGY